MRDSDIAYEKIRLMITTAKLRPGQVIVEADLMKELGMGRTPVREALNRLSWEKFARIIPRQCIMVSDLPLYELESLFEIRHTLSALEGRLAASRHTEAQLQGLRATVDQLHETEDAEASVMLDREFHRQITQMTQNQFLIQEMDITLDLCLRLLFLQREQVESINTASISEYECIYNYLASRDEEGLGKALQEHVLDFRKIFL